MKKGSRWWVVVLGTILASALVTAPADATPGLTSFTPDAVDPIPGYFLGYRFTANSNLTVDKLAAYDHDGDGLTNTHQVGLWTAGGTLLGSVTVSTTDPLNGLFRYRALSTTISLLAGSDYILGAEVTTPDPYVYQASSIVFEPRLTYVDSYWNPSNTFGVPGIATGGSRQYMSANLNIEPVPEPSTILLLGAGLAGVAGMAWRRARRR